MRPENEALSAEQVDQAFRSLVLPGVSNVLKLEIDVPPSTRLCVARSTRICSRYA